ncbi:hypothetical protein Q5692_10980 [Microcoleus sp. C2C3]|uniref:hypothetical protein n=1 Tax=unclassified Microcoleus TaxID=2642155 RepID=UPI002FD053C2
MGVLDQRGIYCNYPIPHQNTLKKTEAEPICVTTLELGKIKNQKSNQKSKIKNQKSKIKNQKSIDGGRAHLRYHAGAW